MHDFEPSDMKAVRPPLGDRLPAARRPPSPSPEQASAIDQAIEEIEDTTRRMAGAIRRAGVVHQADIDDATQDAWVKLLERGKDGTSPRDQRAWMATVARNNAINTARRNREKPHDRELFDGFVARPIVGPMDGLDDALDSLSPELRDVVISMAVEARTAKESAEFLDISLSMTYRRIRQLREELGSLLMQSAEPRSRGSR